MAGNELMGDDHPVEAAVEVAIEGRRLVGGGSAPGHRQKEDGAGLGRPGTRRVDTPDTLAGEVGGEIAILRVSGSLSVITVRLRTKRSTSTVFRFQPAV